MLLLFFCSVFTVGADPRVCPLISAMRLAGGLKGDFGVFKQRRGEAHADASLLRGLLAVVATLCKPLAEALPELHVGIETFLDIGDEATLMGTTMIAATDGQCSVGVAHVAVFESEQVAVAHHSARDVVVGKAHGDAVFIDDLDGEDEGRPTPLPLLSYPRPLERGWG